MSSWELFVMLHFPTSSRLFLRFIRNLTVTTLPIYPYIKRQLQSPHNTRNRLLSASHSFILGFFQQHHSIVMCFSHPSSHSFTPISRLAISSSCCDHPEQNKTKTKNERNDNHQEERKKGEVCVENTKNQPKSNKKENTKNKQKCCSANYQ